MWRLKTQAWASFECRSETKTKLGPRVKSKQAPGREVHKAPEPRVSLPAAPNGAPPGIDIDPRSCWRNTPFVYFIARSFLGHTFWVLNISKYGPFKIIFTQKFIYLVQYHNSNVKVGEIKNIIISWEGFNNKMYNFRAITLDYRKYEVDFWSYSKAQTGVK